MRHLSNGDFQFSSMEERLRENLDRRRQEGSLRSLMPLPTASTKTNDNTSTIQQQNRHSQIPPIDFASNDYLGLARCPNQHIKVQSAYSKMFASSRDNSNTTNNNNAPILGATGSRLLSGDSSLARSLEAYLASPAVHNREAALLFNSGYDANLSILSSLPYRNNENYGADAIIMDELVHNSLVMGVRMGRLSSKRVFLFRHNDVEDLKRILDQIGASSGSSSTGSSRPSVLIVVESVYSMDGDVAPLKEILDISQNRGAAVMVDEAHGLGVYGHTNSSDLRLESTEESNATETKNSTIDTENNIQTMKSGGGTGVLAALNLEHHPALLCSVHTFGKAAGCHGAVVAGSNTLISYLINYARPFVYSTALPPHSLVSIQQSYESMMGIEGEQRRKQVFQLVQLFRQKMSVGLSVLKKEFPSLEFDLLPSPSPIQAVIVPGNERCIAICQYLRNVGKLDVYPIRSPTVAKGKERIRIILHSHNKGEEVHTLVEFLLTALTALKQSVLFPNLDGPVSKL